MVKTIDELKKLTLSPSSINLYLQCPRHWYFQYVLGLKDAETPALLRGTVVHECLEDLFKSTKYVDALSFFKKTLPKKWVKYNLKNETDEEKDFFAETDMMLELFALKHEQKIKMALLKGNVSSQTHAWNLLRPKFRELNCKSEKHNIRGFIDSVEESRDGRIFLVDYKTSNLYKHMISEEYVRQLKLYALMWKEMNDSNPTYLAIDYLKFGYTYLLPFDPTMIDDAIKDIELVRSGLVSTNIEDYPCSNHDWCKYHNHDIKDIPESLKSFALKTDKEEVTKL